MEVSVHVLHTVQIGEPVGRIGVQFASNTFNSTLLKKSQVRLNTLRENRDVSKRIRDDATTDTRSRYTGGEAGEDFSKVDTFVNMVFFTMVAGVRNIRKQIVDELLVVFCNTFLQDRFR